MFLEALLVNCEQILSCWLEPYLTLNSGVVGIER